MDLPTPADKDEEGNLKVVDYVPPARKDYTDEDMLMVLHRLAEGELLTDICKDKDMPASSTFMKYVSRDPVLAREYKRARKIRAVNWCDDIIKIADDDEVDGYIDEAGKPIWNYQHIQRTKMRIQARQWIIKADLPEIFGDKVQVDHSGAVGGGSEKVDAPPQETREQWAARQEERIAEMSAPEVVGYIDKKEEEGYASGNIFVICVFLYLMILLGFLERM